MRPIATRCACDLLLLWHKSLVLQRRQKQSIRQGSSIHAHSVGGYLEGGDLVGEVADEATAGSTPLREIIKDLLEGSCRALALALSPRPLLPMESPSPLPLSPVFLLPAHHHHLMAGDCSQPWPGTVAELASSNIDPSQYARKHTRNHAR